MFLLPLREIDQFGVFVAPVAPLLLLCLALFMLVHWLTRRIDLNRYVWNRPLFEIALFVCLYAVAVLTLRPG